MLLAPLLLLADAVRAEYDVSRFGERVGTAAISRKRLPGDAKETWIRLEMTTNGRKVVVRTRTEHDALGAPLARWTETIPEGGPPAVTDVAFDAAGALVRSGDGPAARVPLARGLSRRDRRETWFWLRRPAPGERYDAFVFDGRDWIGTDVTYVGPTKEGGFRVRAATRTGTTETVYAPDGLPETVEAPEGVAFRRRRA